MILEFKFKPTIDIRNGVEFYIGTKKEMPVKDMPDGYIHNAYGKAKQILAYPGITEEYKENLHNVMTILKAEIDKRARENAGNFM